MSVGALVKYARVTAAHLDPGETVSPAWARRRCWITCPGSGMPGGPRLARCSLGRYPPTSWHRRRGPSWGPQPIPA